VFYNLFSLLYALFLIVIGNAVVLGVDVFLGLYLLILIWLVLKLDLNNLHVKTSQLYKGLFILLIYSILIILSLNINPPYFDNYFIWPIKSILLFSILLILSQSLKNNKTDPDSNLKIWYFILFSVAVIFLVFGYKIDGRLSFIFGPNMLYRITIILFLIVLLYEFSAQRVRKYLSLLSIFLTFFVLSEIGSKGGLVVLLLSLIFLFSMRIRRPIKSLFIVSVLILIVYSFINNFADVPRMLDFSLIQDSIRYSFALEYFENYQVSLLGNGWKDFERFSLEGFMYPHNILIELFMFYGLAGIVVIMAIFVATIKGWHYLKISMKNRVVDHNSIFIMVYIIMLSSSSLSGDLSDNFAVLSLAFYGVLKWKHC